MKEVISNTAFQAFQGFVWAQKKYRVSLPYANFVIANFLIYLANAIFAKFYFITAIFGSKIAKKCSS